MEKEEKQFCFCGKQFNNCQKQNFRKTVCRDNPLNYTDDDGNLFCVFHFPSLEKKEGFEIALYNKIKNEDYLFDGTWFPIEIDFSDHEFNQHAYFNSAIFNFDTSFEKTNFNEDCGFVGTTFKKRVSFKEAKFFRNSKLNDSTNFYSVTFEDVADFQQVIFHNSVNFSGSKFYETDHNVGNDETLLKNLFRTTFSSAHFEQDANFENVIFGENSKNKLGNSLFFNKAEFDKIANFRNAEFNYYIHFTKTIFDGTADFRDTLIKDALNFEEAKFNSYARFSGKENEYKSWSENGFNFSSVEIEKPERIFFQTVQLKPDFFTNTDIRKFDFTDIKWNKKNFAFDWSRFKDFKFWKKEAKERKTSYKTLEKIYHRFATYAEENKEYNAASDFRYTAFDIQRITPWYGRLPITLHWWYKWTSRFGESWLWAFGVLVFLLTLFTFYFSIARFSVCPKDSNNDSNCVLRTLSKSEAVHQTLMTISLQNVIYRKTLTEGEDIIILLMKFFTPIQFGLLFLAIRRKFMR
jgi:hypothetical protein